MTLANQSSAVTYLGNGSTTEWSFNFPVTDPGWLQVKTKDQLGTLSVIPPTDYTLVDGPSGGAVIYPKAGSPLAVGWRIRIQRILPLTQEVDIVNQEAWYPELLESTADYGRMIDQQINQRVTDWINADVWD